MTVSGHSARTSLTLSYSNSKCFIPEFRHSNQYLPKIRIMKLRLYALATATFLNLFCVLAAGGEMRLTDLPTEILDAVAEYVPAKALRELACTCSMLHEVALKQLWYQIRIDFSMHRHKKHSRKDREEMGGDSLYIHKKPSKITAFEIDCLCRRSTVFIDMSEIEWFMTLHSKRPLPLAYVRRLLITLAVGDYRYVDEFTSHESRQRSIVFKKALNAYYQFFFEIIPNLNLTSILVIPVHMFTATVDMFKMVDYLANLSSAPVYMSTRSRAKQSTFGQAELNMSNLRMIQLDLTSSSRPDANTRELLKEFLQKMVMPNLENINLCSEGQITAAMEDFEAFFAHCKTLKVLRLHGVYPLGTTVNWIPNSVTVLHLLGTSTYGRNALIKPDQNLEDFVTALPNVAELLLSGSRSRPLPISPHQLFLPNLRKLILKGSSDFETSFLEFVLQKYCQSVQDFRAYDISYNQLAPLIHMILPLQTLIVKHHSWMVGEAFIESWRQFVPQLCDIDTAILVLDYGAVKDCSSACRTLSKNNVNYIIVYDGLERGPPNSKPPKRRGFYMSCDICSRDDAPLSKQSQIIAQSFNH